MIETYIIYNSILFFSTLFVFFGEKSKNNILSFSMYFISFLVLFIPAALRYNIGADYFSYVNIFDSIKDNPELYNKELGFYILSKLVIFFDGNGHSVIVLCSFVIYFIYYLSLPSKYKYFYHFLYVTTFYLVGYNLIRSAIVFSFALLLFKLFENRKTKSFILVFILGCLFHNTMYLIGFLFVVNYLLPKVFISNWFVKFSLTMCLAIFIFRNDIFSFLMHSSFVDYLGYSKYVNSIYNSQVALGSGIGVLLSMLSLIVILIYSDKFIDETKKNKVVVLLGFACLLSVIAGSTIVILFRLQRVYGLAFVLLPIMLLLSDIRIKFKKIIILYIFAWRFISFEMDINHFRSNYCSGSRISPYVSIFNKYDDRSLSGVMHSECMKW